ncbi:MAG: DUF58 domain-containing protein [candidate division WOR-3 bacterium]
MNRLIDPQLLEFLRGKGIDVEKILEGYLKGKHKSPFIGHSLDYKDLRPYERGDDLKFVDWRVYGRTERFFVKRFEEETNIRVLVILDTSGSMGVENKGKLARALASVFFYVSYLSRDAFSLFAFNEDEVFYSPPSTKYNHLVRLLNVMYELNDHKSTKFLYSINKLSFRVKKRSLLLVISDFFMDVEEIERFVKFFKAKGHEIIFFPIISEKELAFTPGNFVLRDSESEITLAAEKGLLSDLRARLKGHFRNIGEVCIRFGVKYFEFFVERDLNLQLRRFFEG